MRTNYLEGIPEGLWEAIEGLTRNPIQNRGRLPPVTRLELVGVSSKSALQAPGSG